MIDHEWNSELERRKAKELAAERDRPPSQDWGPTRHDTTMSSVVSCAVCMSLVTLMFFLASTGPSSGWPMWPSAVVAGVGAVVVALVDRGRRKALRRCNHIFRMPIPGYGGYYGIYCLEERGHAGDHVPTRDEPMPGQDCW